MMPEPTVDLDVLLVNTKHKEVLIYCLEDPRHPAYFRYGGKTVRTLQSRLRGHVGAAKRSHFPVHVWIRNLLEEGVTPNIVLMEVVEPGGEWEKIEKELIKKLRETDPHNLNVSRGGGGGGMVGRKASKETRLKLSKIAAGRPIPKHVKEAARQARLGSKHSAEICAKISERLLSPEINAKLVAAQANRTHDAAALIAYSHGRRGTKRAPEIGKKIGDANRGRKHTPETLAKMSVSANNRTAESLGFLGKNHKAESKQKISEKLTGRKLSPETLAKRAATMEALGTRHQISLKLTGRKNVISPEGLASIARKKAQRAEEKRANGFVPVKEKQRLEREARRCGKPKKEFTMNHRAKIALGLKNNRDAKVAALLLQQNPPTPPDEGSA